MIQIATVVALFLFALAMLAIGVFSRRRASTIEGFLLGSRKVGAWMSAFSYGTSYFSAVIFIGYAGTNGWNIGFASLWIGVGNALLGCLLAWKVLGPRTRAMTRELGVSTMPGFFEARYKAKNLKIVAAVLIFVFLLPYSAAVYRGLGSLFAVIFPGASLFGLPATTVCMLFIAILTGLYLSLGGYAASAKTDFVQGILMLFGVVALVVAVLASPFVGGLSAGMDALRAIDPDLLSPVGGSPSNTQFLLTTILLTSFGTWGLPQMVHKFYAIKDESAIKKATIVSTLFALIVGCGAYFVGCFGRLVLGNTLPEGGLDAVIPTLLTTVLGSGFVAALLLALVVLLLLSASMSTLSSIVLSSSSAISVDLLGALRPETSKRSQMRLTRFLCLAFVGLSFVFAAGEFSLIVSIMSFSWGVVSGSFLGPYLLGLFDKKANRAGAWAGLIGGFSTVLLMTVSATLSALPQVSGLAEAFAVAVKGASTYGVFAMGVSVVLAFSASRVALLFARPTARGAAIQKP